MVSGASFAYASQPAISNLGIDGASVGGDPFSPPTEPADAALYTSKIQAYSAIERAIAAEPVTYAGLSSTIAAETSVATSVTIHVKADYFTGIAEKLSAPVSAAVSAATLAGLSVQFDSVKYSTLDLSAVSSGTPFLAPFSTRPRDSKMKVYIDPGDNSVHILLSSVSANLADEVTKLYGDKVKLSVNPASPIQLDSRFNDSAPFYGGDAISLGGGCTSGSAYVDNNSGQSFMITAGHCDGNGVYTYILNTHIFMGFTGHSLENLGTRTSYDAVTISADGGGYAGRVFVGAPSSSSTYGVQASGASPPGGIAYFDGKTTGQIRVSLVGSPYCATLDNGSYVCGLQDVVTSTNQSPSAGGDSGGPVWIYNGNGEITAIGTDTGHYVVNGQNRGVYTRIVEELSDFQGHVITG